MIFLMILRKVYKKREKVRNYSITFSLAYSSPVMRFTSLIYMVSFSYRHAQKRML